MRRRGAARDGRTQCRVARRAPHRVPIGINLGDIINDGDDIFGDGVNIAARLEALAEPGGICVSRVVRDQVRDRLAIAFEDRGEQRVKNIARPVRIYRVLLGTEATPAATEVSDAALNPPLPLPDRPSIAVLPFQNMSGDPSRNTSPTAWSRRSSPRSRGSDGFS